MPVPQRRCYIVVSLLAVLVIVGVACGQPPTKSEIAGSSHPVPGGRLIATSRTPPSTFNRLTTARTAEELVSRLTQGRLVRYNRVTKQVEPWLAREWAISPNGLVWTLTLRSDVTFSDGVPFTSGDVLFTFQSLYDPKVKAVGIDSFLFGRKPLKASAPDPQTVVLEFPEPYGGGIGLLDALPIFPRHRLEAALVAGRFRDAWGLATPLADIVGLGPFVVRDYVPGERLVFARNDRYWRRDETGAALPYLAELELQFVPDANAESLRLQSGEVDVVTDFVRPDDLATFRRLASEGRVQLADAGVSVSPDFLVFNLVPGAKPAQGRPWLQALEFRQALAAAVDRQFLINNLYFGSAVPISGPITSGYGDWYVPTLPRIDYDPVLARALLESAGLKDRTGDGLLDDMSGKTVRFSILTQKSTMQERAATMVQNQLRQVGLTVEVAPLEQQDMLARYGAGDYDVFLFFWRPTALDPALNLDFWLSSGGFHLWNPNQTRPGTSWEAEIDAEMRRVASTMDPAARRRAFETAQRTLAAHLPVVYFVAPNNIVPMSARVRGAAPSVLPAPVLWNAEQLYLADPATRPPR